MTSLGLVQQMIPPVHHPLTRMCESVCSLQGEKGLKFKTFIASNSTLKVDAVSRQLSSVIKNMIPNIAHYGVAGFPVESGINEQPVGLENTREGALNRLQNLKNVVEEELFRSDDLTIFVSIENGIFRERVSLLKSPEDFVDNEGYVWVDRAVVIQQIFYKNFCWDKESISLGVPVPLFAVEASRETNWNETAGSFISKKYHLDPKDWHEAFSGKTRQEILEEAISRCS